MKIQTTKVYRKIQQALEEGYTVVSEQGSSRSSKTYNTLIFLIVYLLQHPHTRLSVVRATLPALKGSCYIDFKEILQKMNLYDAKQLNRTELTYQFPNGSWVEFFSTDSETKLRGRKRDILFVNEANELSFIEWQQLKMRTTRFAILDYNPSFSDEHWITQLNAEPQTCHFVTTYKDNPFLERTIVEEIESLRHKNESLWRVYGLGQQAVIEGVIFKEFDLVDELPDRAKRRWVGVDFGFTNDPTAIVTVACDGDGLYLDEVCYRTHMLTGEIITELKRAASGLRVVSESSDPRLVEEIYRAGVNIHPVKKFPDSIKAGISKMQEFRLHVTKRSTNIIREFHNYTYQQDKNGRWLNDPIDANNHACDAIRYVVMEQLMGGERKPIDRRRISQVVY